MIEEVLEIVEQKEKLVRNRELVLHNDEVNTFDHVIDCLIRICGHDLLQAEQCTMIVHYNGKCTVKTAEFDKLKPMWSALVEEGLNAEIQ
ncbi:ATP-dependent Clp protease adaptor ClpS [Cryomorphaceae bacterium]|jgi:ATP-dependent Clp protease adaptor protein ClpS|nr:ATP-dependent Clp protease adaptor ClpS [Cryomorphaceae bacterium]